MNALVARLKLDERTAPLRARWAALPPREQRLVLIGAGAVALLLFWLILLSPALRTLSDAPPRARAQEATWMQMQALASEARELRALPPVSAAQSAQALQSATARLGSRGKLALQGDRATLTLIGGTPEDLRNWLNEVRSGARARAVDMQISRTGAVLAGTITVALPAAP